MEWLWVRGVNTGVLDFFLFFFVMIRRPPRSTQGRSSAASDVYKRQAVQGEEPLVVNAAAELGLAVQRDHALAPGVGAHLSLIHISEPTRPY